MELSGSGSLNLSRVLRPSSRVAKNLRVLLATSQFSANSSLNTDRSFCGDRPQ